MISFTPVSDTTFRQFVDYFVPDYAAEIVENYRLSLQEALQQARLEVENSFPLAHQTPGQILLCIHVTQGATVQHVGYLWYKPDNLRKSVFISEFYLYPAFRHQGLGGKALRSLEAILAVEGFTQINLRVAGDNEQARHLYEKSGFRVTGVNMNKQLVP